MERKNRLPAVHPGEIIKEDILPSAPNDLMHEFPAVAQANDNLLASRRSQRKSSASTCGTASRKAHSYCGLAHQ